MLLLSISNPLITNTIAVSQILVNGSSTMLSSLLGDPDSSSSGLDGNSHAKDWQSYFLAGVSALYGTKLPRFD